MTNLYNEKAVCLPNSEDLCWNYPLDYLTKFYVPVSYGMGGCLKIVLNIGFKAIKFEKKRMVLHFLLLELLTSQKCVITVSKKNLIAFKIKKGSVTGCKVTLRAEHLQLFFDTLLLALPRSEVFKGLSFKLNTNKSNSFSTKLQNLFIFYALESEQNSFIKLMDLVFNFNTVSDVEKRFFFAHRKIPLNLLQNN